MSEETYDYDDATGIVRSVHFQSSDDAYTFVTRQDVTPIAEDAKAHFNSVDERTPWKGEMHRVASIPMTIFMDLQKKGIIKDKKAFAAWLNHPDNRVFRTRPGKV